MSFLHPLGPDLLRHNLYLLAERLKWPEGVVEEVDRIETDNAGWLITWRPEGDKPAGFYARHRHPSTRETDTYGATLEEIAEKIRAHRCEGWPDITLA